jgi:hypothetical protein
MTCIVGLIDKGTIYMGGDSAGVGGYSLMIRADSKVFRNGDFIMGFTSSFRMGDLLRYKFSPPLHDPKMDVRAYMATAFVDAVRQCFKDGGYAQKDKDQEAGGMFLVGYKGRLFYIGEDYQVGESLCGYDAVGCGLDIARGALFATQGRDPEERIMTALRAAEMFSAGVRGPFHLEASGDDSVPPAPPKPVAIGENEHR